MQQILRKTPKKRYMSFLRRISHVDSDITSLHHETNKPRKKNSKNQLEDEIV